MYLSLFLAKEISMPHRVIAAHLPALAVAGLAASVSPAGALIQGVSIPGGQTGTSLPGAPSVRVGGGIHAVGGIYTLRRVDIRSNSSGNIVGGLSFVWLMSFDLPVGRLDMEDCSVTSNYALVSPGGNDICDCTADVNSDGRVAAWGNCG